MDLRIALLAAALCCAGTAHALPMSKDEYKAQQLRIEGEYDQAQGRCKRLAGNARDVCNEQARGDRDVAQAALALQYKPTVENDEKLRLAKADAAYGIALQRCRALDGDSRDVCRKDAKDVLAQAKEDARLQEQVVAQQMRADGVVRERTEREEKLLEAQYNAARTRCEMLPDDGRMNCLIDAKKKFGKL